MRALKVLSRCVSVDPKQLGAFQYYFLDGISFRCEPAGKNGCR